MHTLNDMLSVHNCCDVLLYKLDGKDPEFRREFHARFWQLGATFAGERGVSSFPDLMDDPSNPKMGPKAESKFYEMLFWLATQGVYHDLMLVASWGATSDVAPLSF